MGYLLAAVIYQLAERVCRISFLNSDISQSTLKPRDRRDVHRCFGCPRKNQKSRKTSRLSPYFRPHISGKNFTQRVAENRRRGWSCRALGGWLCAAKAA